MNIKNLPAQLPAKQTPPVTTPPAPPASEEPGTGCLIRDVAAIGAGATAAVVGGIYGLAEGAVVNGVQNFPAHVKKGAELGSKIATPIGGALGAIATGAMVALSAIATPIGTAIATGLGFVGGTAVSAAKQSPASISETSQKGAESGAKIGAKLGSIGENVGTVVGCALGGIAGIGVAIGRGVPDGVSFAKETFQQGVDTMKQLPTEAKQIWNTMVPTGREVASVSGAVIGGSTGLVTAAGETALESVVNSVKRGTQFAQAASGFVAGK